LRDMKYFVYFIVILSFFFFDISASLSEEYHRNYTFDNNSDLLGWRGIKTLEEEESGYALKISQNDSIIVSVKNRASFPGTIRFNYSIPGCFNSKCKLNFSIDGVPDYLSPKETEETSTPYAVDTKSKEHNISWNCTCLDCPPNIKNGPRCIVDDVAISNIEIASVIVIPLQEITLDPSDKYLNDKINSSSNKAIKLKKGLHIGPIIIGAGAENIKIEPEKDQQTGKYVDVTFDGDDTVQALKLIDTNGIVLENIALRNADKALILDNSSNCTIRNINISNFKVDGVYLLNCTKQANRIEFNTISAKYNKTYPFNIENSNDTIFFQNKIEIQEARYHYYLNNSYNNRIYIPNFYVRCPIVSNEIKCVLEKCYDFNGKYANTSNDEEARNHLGNWLIR